MSVLFEYENESMEAYVANIMNVDKTFLTNDELIRICDFLVKNGDIKKIEKFKDIKYSGLEYYYFIHYYQLNELDENILTMFKKRLHENSIKKEPTNLKKLIDELNSDNLDSAENIIFTQSSPVPISENDSDLVNFFSLYHQVVKAEDDNQKTIQDIIRAYYNFG